VTDLELRQLRQELRGSTPLSTCNKEAGSFSELWGRDCWIADSVLSLIQCSIDEEMDSSNLSDPLYKVYQYCEKLREKNRIGDFADTIGA
jgi:hypothetical protein